MSLRNKVFIARMLVVHRFTGVITEPGYVADVAHCTEDELLNLLEMGAIEVMPEGYTPPPPRRYDQYGHFIGYAEAEPAPEVSPAPTAAKSRKNAKTASESEGS